jgi:ATP-dependent DNA helicase DinG
MALMEHEKQILAILGPDGVLARSMEGYEHRKQQTLMAIQVYEALTSKQRLIVEAPTGTGKTLAYLVAAALSRKRVAVTTGTKNLQEQLFFKDIPFLKSKVFPKLKAALLKGRGNFICHERLRRYLRQPYLEGFVDPGALKEIVAWYRRTRETGDGDRAELVNLPDDDRIWPEICATSDTCLGKRCPDRDECFVLKMRTKAADVDIMVINHYLLASDLVVKESGFGEVIPRYDALIVDEAHGLEDALTQHFGFHMNQTRLVRLIRDVRSELGQAAAKEEKFQVALKDLDDHGRRLFANFQNGPPGAKRLGRLSGPIVETRDLVCRSLATLAAMISNVSEGTDELRSMAKRASDMREELDTILADDPAGDYACWIERKDRAVILHASPVEVAGMLRSKLYDKVSSVVFTSATLSSGGNFAYFSSRLGLNDEPLPRETILDSPFDYARQTMLFIPPSIPEPNAPEFLDAMTPLLEEILTHTRGRAFVLFTSHRNMVTAHANMQGRVPFPLLIQGTKPKSRLLEDFRSQEGSVLFATSSFWEGVDVQGEALSCVIVDRLPFAPPDDPVVSARIERIRGANGEPFYSFQVPMAVIALKQGLGRLIRTRSDRGILCILDKRILTKSYGRVFRNSLYDSPLRRNIQDIKRFFAQ